MVYHSSIDGHLGCVFLAPVNNNAMKCVYGCLFAVLLSIPFGYISRSKNSTRCRNSIFNYLRSYHAVFQSTGTILHSDQRGAWIPISPHPRQHLFFSVSVSVLFSSCLVGTRWYRVVVFDVHYPVLSDGEYPGHSLTWSYLPSQQLIDSGRQVTHLRRWYRSGGGL